MGGSEFRVLLSFPPWFLGGSNLLRTTSLGGHPGFSELAGLGAQRDLLCLPSSSHGPEWGGYPCAIRPQANREIATS